MFNIDPRMIQRIARHTDRVLIVDPNPNAARLLADLLKTMGARQPQHAVSTKRALELALEIEPQLVFTEFSGPELDGVELITRLRRSPWACRKAGVIVVTSEAREGTIKGARDAGAHEFLCKPFTAGHLFKRVENVVLKPRPWIEAQMYVGPDRRRFNAGEFAGSRKRRSDASIAAAAVVDFARAEAGMRAGLDQLDADPIAALRMMLEMAAELQGASAKNPELGGAIAMLQRYLLAALETGGLSRNVVEGYLGVIAELNTTHRTKTTAPAKVAAVG